jgi:hypothetical protein
MCRTPSAFAASSPDLATPTFGWRAGIPTPAGGATGKFPFHAIAASGQPVHGDVCGACSAIFSPATRTGPASRSTWLWQRLVPAADLILMGDYLEAADASWGGKSLRP